jgi:glycine cleavage system H lipoate-binding protein
LSETHAASISPVNQVMTTIRGFDFPDDLFYLMEHDAWVRLDPDGNATTGITPLGAHISGEFIEFMAKPIGTLVDRERALGMLEMSKVIRSARSPISGVIASVNERELSDAEIVISQPFWPAYLTAERIAKARKLKLAITAGIGSDHVDLEAAIKHGVTVAEVTYSNSISVSEQVVMMILALVRNYIPSYQWIVEGGWNIADCVARSYDLEAMQVGTVAAGRIGLAVL